jgi:hypothetical protein
MTIQKKERVLNYSNFRDIHPCTGLKMGIMG